MLGTKIIFYIDLVIYAYGNDLGLRDLDACSTIIR